MTTIKLPTVEGHEIELDVADHVKLCAWPDLDLSRIHVVGDDTLHAVKPSTGNLHALSLEEMLRVRIKPCNGCKRDLPEIVFPTSRTSPGYRNTCAACRNARRRTKRETDAALAAAPLTGPPGHLIKRYAAAVAAKSVAAWVSVDGERRDAPAVDIGDLYTRVPLTTPGRVFVGFVRIATPAYRLLVSPLIKASRGHWVLQPNGQVTTRATAHLKGKARSIRWVSLLLQEHGISEGFTVEREAFPSPVRPAQKLPKNA